MKAKIMQNKDNRAMIALLDEAGNPAHHLELVLHDSTKGKDADGNPVLFQYWAFEKGTDSKNDLTDFQDWIGALGEAGALPCEADLWIRDALGYRLNNGKFKTIQKVSIDGKRIDSLSPDEKLANVAKSLEGAAFKLRESGDSKATLKTKLTEVEDKNERMVSIFNERRDLESERKTAKDNELPKIDKELAKLDAEFAALNPQKA